MAIDFSLPVRRVVLPELKARDTLTALVPAGSIFPSTVPANALWPFIRYGASIPTPFRASGLDSSRMTVRIDGFSKAVMVGASMIETAEDRAHKIAAEIAACLDDRTLTLATGEKARFAWSGSTVRMDGAEAGAWHASVGFRVEVAG